MCLRITVPLYSTFSIIKINLTMKFLIIGFLVLFGWSALSYHIYVCKIKGLCNEPTATQIEMVSNKDTIAGDTLSKPLAPEKAALPENLSIYFAFDKSEFNSDVVTDRYFDAASAYLNQNSQARLSITGHTDAIGSDEYNQALGYRRAQSVQRYFENKGISAGKIIAESKGEKAPSDDNNTATGRAKNRRTEITIKY
jgi:outer membrane protein OmpA-like peptidoglycan-associated protein